MKQFTFKYHNNKGALYVLSSFFIIPLVVILGSFALVEYSSWALWVFIPLGVGAIVYCMSRYIKISKDTDTIMIDSEGFSSKNYGRIQYDDIESMPSYGRLGQPFPSTKIKLKNGKKIIWNFNPQNQKSKSDIETFIAFRNELLRNLEDKAEQCSKNEEKQSENLFAKLVQQLKSSKKQKYKYITLSLSVVVALLMVARTCGEDFIQNKRKREAKELTNMALKMEIDYESNRAKAQKIATDYSRKFGPVSLFTNDPKAKIEFIPEIDSDPYTPKINIFGLRREEDNKNLEKYIKNPDRVAYHMTVVNSSIDFFSVMSKGIFTSNNSDDIPIYLTVYNPNESLPVSKFRAVEDTVFRPIHVNTSIKLPIKGSLTEDALKNMNYASIRSILSLYKGTFFYLAAKNLDGISIERFEKLKEIITADFEKHGISTENFQTQRFNVQ